jgi:hypothetical protein
MKEETEIDTRNRTDYLIELLSWKHNLSGKQASDLALLLRRYRKLTFGSALTDTERAEGRSEINP